MDRIDMPSPQDGEPAGPAEKKRPIVRILLLSIAALLVLSAIPVAIACYHFERAMAAQVPIVDVRDVSVDLPATDSSLQAADAALGDSGEDEEWDVAAEDVPIYKKAAIDEKTVNILFIGCDARPNQKSGRADTMMLLSYNRDLGQARLVSLLRDSWVPIEGHSWNRINTAYAFGGIGLAINTVNRNFGLDIQDYVVLGFDEFVLAVDEIGGIEMYLTQKEADFVNEKCPKGKVKEGWNTLDGEQALFHARDRYTGNGDFERTRRQRDVLFTILDKLRAEHDPVKLMRVFNKVVRNVKTDVPADVLFALTNEILSGKDIRFETASVPFDDTWRYASKDGRSVLSIDIAKNAQMLHQLLYGAAGNAPRV